MPQINFTEELGLALKELRKENKVTSKELSESISKSVTYISKLENGSIKKIDLTDMMTIFHTIFKEDKYFEKNFEEFIGKCTIKLTDDEIQKREWLLNFDTVIRKIPIPPDLVEYINEQLQKLNLSIAEIVSRINLNEDLVNAHVDMNSSPKNLWHMINGHPFICLELSIDTFEKILTLKTNLCNYVTLESFVYNLLKYIYSDKIDARKNTISLLTQYKFYSIRERNKMLKKCNTDDEIEEILTDFDKINNKLISKILYHFNRFSDFNIKYTNDRLDSLVKNLDDDTSLVLAFLGIDLTSLKDLDVSSKKNLIKEVEALVKKYSIEIPKKEELQLI